MLTVHFFQPGPVHMGINLRGGNGSVAEHALDTADVRAVAQKVGGKAVAEGVG